MLNLEEDGQKVIEEKKKNPYGRDYSSGSSSYYRSAYNGESDFRALYFFELSDITRAPKYFARVSDFVTWANKNGIFLSEQKIHELKTMPSSYNICKEGSTTIISRCSRYLLEQAFKESSSTSSSAAITRKEGEYPYCGAYDPHYDDYYSDWD